MKEKQSTENKKKQSWLVRTVIILVFVLLFVFTFLAALLYIPSFQNFAVDRVTSNISSKIAGEVEIGKVKLNIFKGLVASDFSLINPTNLDTVLFAEEVNTDLKDNILSLFRKRLAVNSLEIKGLAFTDIRGKSPMHAKVGELLKSSQSNADTSVAENDGTGTPFELSVEELKLKDFNYTYIDSFRGERRNVFVKDAAIGVDTLLLAEQDFYFSTFTSSNVIFNLTYFEKTIEQAVSEVLTVNEEIVVAPDTFDLYIKNLSISNSEFHLVDQTKIAHNVPLEFDPSRIHAIEVEINATDFYTNSMANISAKIESGSLITEDEQIAIESFSCNEFRLEDRKMVFDGLEMRTENSIIRDELIFRFRNIKDFNNFNDRVIMNGNVANAEVGVRELLYFAPALKQSPFFLKNQARRILFDGELAGRVNSLSSPLLNVRLGEEVAIRGRLNSRNLADVDDALLNLDLEEFSMTVSTLSELIPGFVPPPNFFKLGRLNFVGRFDGYFQDFVAYGDLSSDLGYADLDMRLDLKEGAESAQYSGAATLKSFDLAYWSGNNEFGLLEMEAQVKDGKGLRIESVNADLKANVNVLEYKGYTYRDFNMEGKFEKNLFDGNFIISDPNIDLDFSGTIDFTDSIPVYDFVADVNALKLKNLNILEEDFGLEGFLTINANGTDINNAQGKAFGTEFILYKDGNTFKLDSFDLTAKGAFPERRNFVLESSLADIELNGTFKIEELPDAFLSGLKTNYPNFTQQLTYFKYPNPSPGYDFNINLTVRESEDIFEVLLGESIFIRDATILGRISDETNRSALDISFPFLEVNGNVFGGITGDLFAQSDEGKLSFLMEYANIEGVEFSPIKVEAEADQEQIDFAIESAELLDTFTNIQITGALKTLGELYDVQLTNTSFDAFGSHWEFNDNNRVVFGKELIKIEDLQLSDGERALTFVDINGKGVAAQFVSLNTSFFNRLTGAEMRGEINGSVEVKDVFNFDGLNASLTIPSFGFENHEFGNVQLEANSDNLDEPISYRLIAYDQAKNLEVTGNYFLDSKVNEGQMRVNAYPLNLLEYIITDGLSNTVGTVDASLKFSGPFAYPEFNGEAVVSNGSAKIDYLGTTYKIGKNSIKLSEGYIDFTDGELIDDQDGIAVVSGGLRHNAFRDFLVEVGISSPQFIALNTTKVDNPSYYGFAQGEINVTFSGPFETIDISVIATTGRNTVLNLPVEYTAEEYSSDFIEIVDYEEVEEQITRQEFNLEGLSLDMKVDVTEDARVIILFDETAKDILESSGRGSIRLTIDPTGEFVMSGLYEVVNGQYLFTIPSLLVNKSFLIQPGGQIEWTGDPLNANLNIDATYRGLQTTLTTFLEEYLPPPDAGVSRLSELAKQRTDVSLTMDLGGTMSKPDIDFDISFPNLVGELKPLAEGKLRTLEGNQDAYNDQVFGLILLRTFLPASSNQVGNNVLNTNNLIGTGYSTISEFVSNQFSILLSSLFDEALEGDGYLTGVDVSLSANKNTLGISNSSNGLLPDEYDINFVSSFDENKWNVQLGGSYVVNSLFDVGTYFAPDFVVEYYITEDRRLKLNLYARSDYDASRNRKIQSGIGISYRKEFNSLFDLAKAVKRDVEVD